jgi:hypothetical protein
MWRMPVQARSKARAARWGTRAQAASSVPKSLKYLAACRMNKSLERFTEGEQN